MQSLHCMLSQHENEVHCRRCTSPGTCTVWHDLNSRLCFQAVSRIGMRSSTSACTVSGMNLRPHPLSGQPCSSQDSARSSCCTGPEWLRHLCQKAGTPRHSICKRIHQHATTLTALIWHEQCGASGLKQGTRGMQIYIHILQQVMVTVASH